MSLRLIPKAALAVALSTAPIQLQVAHADEPPAPRPVVQDNGNGPGDDRPAPPPPPNDGENGPGDDRPGPPPPRNDGDSGPRNGGFGGDGPRGGGGDFGPPREGVGAGPRGGGRRGGPLGPAFMGFDEVRPDETAMQRQQRVLQPYLTLLPTLTAEQQTHIMAILDAAMAESRAASANTALPQERRTAATRYVRSDIGNRVAFALTEEQLAPFNAYRAQQAQAQIARGGEGGEGRPAGANAIPAEDPALVRARVLMGYEEVMEELSVKQKTDILAILKDADARSNMVRADTTHSVAARTDALQAIHDDVNAKVLPLLDAEQAPIWKKNHAAKRLGLATLAVTPLPAPQAQPQPQPEPRPEPNIGF